MVRIKPFKGIRPPRQHAAEVASRPYDVLNSEEARREATEKSLLHIIKPEIDFEPIADEHSEEVYRKAVENFARWREEGWLVQDDTEKYYVHMAAAWLTAEILVKYYDFGLKLLQNKVLQPKTHNKAIQKAKESYRLTKEQKGTLESLKIKISK